MAIGTWTGAKSSTRSFVKNDVLTIIKLEGIQNLDIFVDYEVQGALRADLQIGKPLNLLRYKRNKIESLGFFSTSNVVAIWEEANRFFFTTENSVYEIIV